MNTVGNLSYIPGSMPNHMTASPVGSLDQAFLHIHGVVHGFHIHGRGWDGFGFDVRHCGNGLELRDGIRFGLWHEGGWFELWCSMVRLRFGMIWDWFGLWCRMVRLRFGMVGSCSVGWLHVGFGRRVGDNWCGCIMRRFWFHVGGWLRPVHRLWFQVGGWLRTVHRLWPVHGRDGLWLHIMRWFWMGRLGMIWLGLVLVSIWRIVIPVRGPPAHRVLKLVGRVARLVPPRLVLVARCSGRGQEDEEGHGQLAMDGIDWVTSEMQNRS